MAGPALATKEGLENAIRTIIAKEPVERAIYMMEKFTQNFTEGIHQADKKKEKLLRHCFRLSQSYGFV